MRRLALGISLAFLTGAGTGWGTPPAASGPAQHTTPPVSAAPGEPQECVQDTLPMGARLRAMHFALDYEGAVVEGRRFIEETSSPGEPRAWTLLSLAAIYGEADRAIAAAREWARAGPEEPWAWFALAGTLAEDRTQHDQALPASRKAFRLARDHPDFIWLHAKILSESDHAVEALNLIDRSLPQSGNAAQLLALKGEVLLSMSGGEKPDESMRSEAMRLFAKARQADPANITAFYRPGVLLLSRRRLDEALPLLRKAADLSPCSTRIHGNLWSALMGRTDVPLEKKKAEVEADIQELLRVRGHYPGALMAIAAQYGEMGFKTRQKELENRILTDFPDSFQAEWVLVSRYQRFSREHEADLDEPRVRDEYRKMLRAFIESHNHHMGGELLTDAYQALFSTLRDDPAAKPEELLAVVREIAKGRKDQLSQFAPALACSLADRQLELEEAERIVREGMRNSREEARSRRPFNLSRKDMKFWLRFQRAQLTDASGWVHVCQGKLKEGEVELVSAAKQLARLEQPSEDNFFHLGKLSEAKGDLDAATRYYAEGMAVETPRKNPCEEAIRRLYVKRQGSLDGFEDYAEQFRKENRDKRKARVLAERIQQPEPIQAFSLKTLEGQRVSSEQLRGKIVVVKFWGVWCIWCIKEMPDFEKLFEKYRDDPEVAILTIDNDPNPETPREWIRENGYKFPVLLDDDYVRTEAKIEAFPTTWFLDREGRKAFVKDGWSKELEEEFGWRIEALRAGKP